MFGESVSGKLLEKKIIVECGALPSISELEELLLTADPPENSTDVDADFGELLLNILLFYCTHLLL